MYIYITRPNTAHMYHHHSWLFWPSVERHAQFYLRLNSDIKAYMKIVPYSSNWLMLYMRTTSKHVPNLFILKWDRLYNKQVDITIYPWWPPISNKWKENWNIVECWECPIEFNIKMWNPWEIFTMSFLEKDSYSLYIL